MALMRLVAQRLAGPAPASAAEAAAWMTAMQAQDLPGAITSLALRTRSRAAEEVAAAFDSGEIVRTWPMRGTLHLLAAGDLGWMLELEAGRASARAAGRHRELGLDEQTFARAGAATQDALGGSTGLTREELRAAWAQAGVGVEGQRAVHILGHLARSGLVCLGPLRGRTQLVVLTQEWVPRGEALGREAALAHCALRYYRSHGPATVADLARWTGLTLTDARRASELARPGLETLRAGGAEYLLAGETPRLLAEHRDSARAAMLLPGFDELILGYADRSMTLAREDERVVAPGGNGLFRGTVLAGGRAVGVWRRARSGAGIEATPFRSFPRALAARIQGLYSDLPRLAPAA